MRTTATSLRLDSHGVARKRSKNTPIHEVDRARIRRERARRQLSVDDLAAKVSVSVATMYRIENGPTKSTPHLAAIYRSLGISTKLMNRQDPEAEELLALFNELRSHDDDVALGELTRLRKLVAQARAIADEERAIRERREELRRSVGADVVSITDAKRGR